MQRLVLLNGPPGIGKSTLARRFVDDHPGSVNLDVDRIRAFIGGWREDLRSAGVLARAMALAAAQVALDAGRDVIVPQHVGRPEFIERLAVLATESGVDFIEIMLMDDRTSAVRRFTERASRTGDPAHVEAAEVLARLGGVDELVAMYDRLEALLRTRPWTTVIHTVDGQADAAYQALVESLARPTAR